MSNKQERHLSDNRSECSFCSQQTNSLFCNAHRESLEELDREKVCYSFKKGQVVFHEGTRAYGLYCISSGKIKISKNGDDGKEHIYRLAKPGDLIAYKAILSDGLYSASAVALEDADLCFIPKEKFVKLLGTDSGMSMEFIRLLSQELGRAEMKVAHLAQKPVRERLAEAILFVKETYGVDADGETLSARLTRDEIANIVGTATESAIRLLSEFKKDGILELEGKKIRVLDHKRLTAVANLQD